ncbi:interferon alpha-inducible IFI6/IFI27 family protein, partial [Salmonella sp. S146_54837]|uniref:interferon alpha-inducible IFI6/IFI27 family protein n=1 Tax=unclassified Salmonella TaxID=2614656 RepID=UPI001CA7E7A7
GTKNILDKHTEMVFMILALVAVPFVQMVGFTATGITAGSLAAGAMSTAAVANGGGILSMAAWGAVATAQSIGATGALAGSTYVAAAVADGGLIANSKR